MKARSPPAARSPSWKGRWRSRNRRALAPAIAWWRTPCGRRRPRSPDRLDGIEAEQDERLGRPDTGLLGAGAGEQSDQVRVIRRDRPFALVGRKHRACERIDEGADGARRSLGFEADQHDRPFGT